MKVRVQKVLAEAGVTSRRGAEELILEGRLTVNGELVNELPCFVDPAADDIRVDGVPVRRRPRARAHFLLNKPKGVVCAMTDPAGRPVAADFAPGDCGRLYCIGGLDDETTGLVLLTNDGELTRRLTERRRAVRMTYLAEVDGALDNAARAALRQGVFLEDRRTKPIEVAPSGRDEGRSVLELRTTEASSAAVRRVFHRLGHKVRRLARTAIGPLTDQGLKIGRCRPLTHHEVQLLLRTSGAPDAGPRKESPRAQPRGRRRPSGRDRRRSGPDRRRRG